MDSIVLQYTSVVTRKLWVNNSDFQKMHFIQNCFRLTTIFLGKRFSSRGTEHYSNTGLPPPTIKKMNISSEERMTCIALNDE